MKKKHWYMKMMKILKWLEITDLTESGKSNELNCCFKEYHAYLVRKIALNKINFEIKRRDFGFLGPSGSGKTTMINILMVLITKMVGIPNYWERILIVLNSTNLEKIGIVSDGEWFLWKIITRKNLYYYMRNLWC